MLTGTFTHLPDIDPDAERNLWEQGIRDWDDLEAHIAGAGSGFSADAAAALQQRLEDSREALAQEDICFFAGYMHPREHYRIALTFPNKTCFLDIETTGLSPQDSVVTVIGIGRTGGFDCYINDERSPPDEWLEDAGCLVTFNGARFDVPFIRAHYPELALPPAHTDLMWMGWRVALKGGQKILEKQTGFRRPPKIQGVEGRAAVLLWESHVDGDPDALETLLRYNESDIAGMQFIFPRIVDRMVETGILPSFLLPTSQPWWETVETDSGRAAENLF